jgi:peptide-methionine (S)-S-oxide reductase
MRISLSRSVAGVFITLLTCLSVAAAEQTAVFAGGCFWGVEAVFEHVKGVTHVRSGYAGGSRETANYADVSSGSTDHAEVVEIRFDPAKVAYEQLLYVFFTVAHDPTEVDRQGPDNGRQYRSAIFYSDEKQKKSAAAFIASINASKVFDKPVATQIVPLAGFFAAEEYHQDYLKKHPDDSYIVTHDLPKLEALRNKFPALYRKYIP